FPNSIWERTPRNSVSRAYSPGETESPVVRSQTEFGNEGKSARSWSRILSSTPARRPKLRPIAGRALQFFFDAHELIVLRDPLRAARRTGLDLPGVRGHGQVGDGRVLGFPAAVADDRGVAVPPGELDGVERFRQRTDLVHLDQNTVARRLGDALLQALGV